MKTRTPEEYLAEPYTYLVIQDEDGTFAVEVQEFEGCFSQGETADEAMANIREAAANWIEATLRSGKQIPPPVAANEASGKFALRLPRNVHQKIQRLAEMDGVSVNTFLVEAIAEKIGAIEYCDRQMANFEQRMARKTVATIAAMFLPATQSTGVYDTASTDDNGTNSQRGKPISIQLNQ